MQPVTLTGICNTEAGFPDRRRPEGRLTPAARHLILKHLNMTVNMVDRVCRILPVTDRTPEVNRPAFMRMEDGSVQGTDCLNGRLRGSASPEEHIEYIMNSRATVQSAAAPLNTAIPLYRRHRAAVIETVNRHMLPVPYRHSCR